MKFIIDDSNKLVAVEALRVGLKLEVRENELKKLQNNECIREYFKLNIKRLNRWWYSVYFDEKPDEAIE